jgi:hypothetical protein
MSILQIFIGISLLTLGVYGILIHWWTLVDLASVVIPLCLVLFGVLSILTGISSMREKEH